MFFATYRADARIPWTHPEYWQLLSEEDPLSLFLEKFCRLQEIPVSIEFESNQVVSGSFSNVQPEDFLTNICKLYGLVWYYDGLILHFVSISQVKTMVFGGKFSAASELKALIDELGYMNASLASTFVDADNILILTAPAGLLDLISVISQSLSQYHATPVAERTVIEVFPLSYAWAYDLDFNYGDTAITIPGVANVVAEIVYGATDEDNYGSDGVAYSSVSGSSGVSALQPSGGVATKGWGSSDTSSNNDAAGEAGASSGSGSKKSSSAKSGAGKETASIEQGVAIIADPRTNSVIIKDSRKNIPIYRKLIEELDQPVQIISIQVVIVDVQGGINSILGVNQWQVSGHGQSLGASNVGSAYPDGEFVPHDITANVGGEVNIFDSYTLSFALDILETNSYSQTISEPTVLTFNNMEAVIGQEQNAYTNVPGTFNSSVFTVTTGLKLQVTPQIIDQDGENIIKLLVSIEDGGSAPGGTDTALAPTSRNYINTQALINESESLLVGGVYGEKIESSDSGIPYLKDIPVLGFLFGDDNQSDGKTERLYIITPRIVDISNDPETEKFEMYNQPLRTVPEIFNTSKPPREPDTFYKNQLNAYHKSVIKQSRGLQHYHDSVKAELDAAEKQVEARQSSQKKAPKMPVKKVSKAQPPLRLMPKNKEPIPFDTGVVVKPSKPVFINNTNNDKGTRIPLTLQAGPAASATKYPIMMKNQAQATEPSPEERKASKRKPQRR